MNILIIDTSSNKIIKVGLQIDQEKYVIKQKIGPKKAQVVLPLIEKLLQKHNLKLSGLSKIGVNTGPGSFTGLRVGIAIANALSFALNIPINRKNPGEFVQPSY